MRIACHVTVEDHIAFRQYHAANSPAMRRHRYLQTFITMVISVVTAAVLAFLGQPWIAVFLVIWATLFVLLRILLPGGFWNKRLVRKLLSEGQTKGTFGPREFEVTDEGITQHTARGQVKVLWNAVEKVVSTQDHTFIFISPTSAFVIPRREIPIDDYISFMREVALKRQGVQPVPVAAPVTKP